MLESLQSSDFSPLLNQVFKLAYDPALAPLELELVQVEPFRSWAAPLPPGQRRPFSLLFLGPLDPLLPQRIYSLEHPALGVLEIFIVPLGPQQGRMQYEVVFG